MHSIEDKIVNLWKWFEQNEGLIKSCLEDEFALERDDIIEQLNNLVLDFGMFTWQIGPQTNNAWFFTISPNGNKDLIKISKKIMENAPDLYDWEFNHCKPAVEWDREFVLYDNNMDEQFVNASEWKFYVIEKSDGKNEIIIEAQNILHLDEDTASLAADIVVMNELGEELKIQKISTVKIVTQHESEHIAGSSSISHLKQRFH